MAGRASCHVALFRILISCRGHQPCGLAVSPLPAQPARGDEMLAARGIVASHATARQWAPEFGREFADRTRRRLPCAGDRWHLDEAAIKIAGVKRWPWCAVGRTGPVLDVLVQSRRDKQAPKRLLRKLVKRPSRVPRVMTTDKLPNCGVAKREVMPGIKHRQQKGSNNRAENSRQPMRRREWQMKHFKSARQAQRFLSAHDQVDSLFQLHRDHVTAVQHRAGRAHAFAVWADISRISAAT
jgi:putative transposase